MENKLFTSQISENKLLSLQKRLDFLHYCTPEYWDCTVKKVSDFPVPSRDVTNQTLPGRELLNYSWPQRVWLVTYRLGVGKTLTLFTVEVLVGK